MTSGDRQQVLAYVRPSLMFSDEEVRTRSEVIDLVLDWAEFYWQPLRHQGPFDYGDPAYFGRSTALWTRAAKASVCGSSR